MRFILRWVSNLLIISGLSIIFVTYAPIVKDEIWFYLKEWKGQSYEINDEQGVEDSVFARFLSSKPVSIKPVNTNFSIVIERIGVNAPIVKNVEVIDKDAYERALKDGVAHALVSDLPSKEPGNVYLFAHSAVNFWRLGRYAKVFNLLRKLEPGDEVHIFYRGQDYVYEVVNSEVYKGWNTLPLTRKVIEPVLTLQTCDPPGTTLNRLVVTATLKEVLGPSDF